MSLNIPDSDNMPGPHLHPWHVHPLYLSNLDNGWFCDGHKFGRCYGNYVKGEEYKTTGEKRYRCKICDFDLCGKCFNVRNGEIKSPYHEHSLCLSFVSNGWKCDCPKPPCLSNIVSYYQSSGITRYHCYKCDFDLCRNCLYDSIKSNENEKVEFEKEVAYSPLFSGVFDNIQTMSNKCLKCNLKERDSMVLHNDSETGHIAFCLECAKKMTECELCHKTISRVVTIY